MMLMLYAVDRGTCHARRGLFVLLKTVLARECGRSDSSLNRDRYTLKRYHQPAFPVDGDTFGNSWYHDGPFFSSQQDSVGIEYYCVN